MPYLLIATKKDLRYDSSTIQKLYKARPFPQSPVTIEQGREMAHRIGAFTYIETSARYNEGVREVFAVATRASLSQNLTKQPKCRCIIS